MVNEGMRVKSPFGLVAGLFRRRTARPEPAEAPIVPLWDTPLRPKATDAAAAALPLQQAPQPSPPPAPAPAQAAVPRPLPPARALFAHLRTGRGNFLVAGNRRVAMDEQADAASGLVAIVPEANRALCFLLSPDLRPLEVQADGMVSIAISAYRLPGEEPASLRLRHPLAPARFLAVTQPGQGGPMGCVIFDSLGRTKLDLFDAVPLATAALTAEVLRVAAELCAAVEPPYRGETLLARFRDGTIRPDLAETLIRVLPRDELDFLAARLLASADDRKLLARLLPENVWAETIIPALAAWNTARGPAGPGNVLTSPPEDEFAADPQEGYGQMQAGHALTGLMRRRTEPRRGACLLAAARNEGPYLLEWLAYHRAIGFEHAFIYTNDNWDGSDRLLEALAEAGAITLVHNQAGTHCGPQYKAQAHALTLLPQILDYRWAALLDLDEYIGFNTGLFANIGEYLGWQESQPVDAIALCWLIFAGLRQDVWRDAFTPARFPRREGPPNQHVKCLFRPRLFSNSHAHFPHSTLGAPFVFRNETGGLHYHAGVDDRIAAFSASPSASMAWINHYLLRSAPEALWKLSRGHGDWKGRVAERHVEMAQFICRTYVSLAAKPDLVEDRRLLTCAPRFEAERSALRALPRVAALEDQIRADFAARLDRMVQAFLDTHQPGEPPEFAPFRTLLREQMGSAAA
jgi:hypothetical protein